ncbi:hypothetical protein BE04_43880 [Sorangium cellulosum]|uniref:Uncharacterized protein n=2 Tax=Sorangium cellulosum TaxID=56 RepID=A0A150PHE3_SORCE|nr:hypothetical protein [Sorangium cellulosum]KYF55121.1 hypothetical protein BE04_43880 [Sorangium cellulosum]KYG04665.1 hypothetical protein BE21_45525 [Sorangium cellulosum]
MLNKGQIRKSNATVMEEMQAWFRDCLGCVAGRREFLLGRYMITVLDDTDTGTGVLDTYRKFRRHALAYEKVACLLVFNNPELYAGSGCTALDAISYLARQIAPLAHEHPDRLIRGGSVHQRHALKCPVTGALTLFDDFDAIAFCPQADDRDDPLYDPLMAAPYPCINISSDVFGFSMFARDRFLHRYNRDIFGAPADDALRRHLTECAALWQKIAARTIRNYIAMTDTTLCPTYLSEDERYWIANHQDPAFAESEKRAYRHEMPVTYTPQIIDRWMCRMEGGSDGRARAVTTRPGEIL